MNLRFLSVGAVALALGMVAPAAQAKNVTVGNVFVCNTASQNWQGDQGTLVVSPDDPQGALHYSDDLIPMPNVNDGLVNAAAHSRALALCDDGSFTGPGGNY